MLKKRNRAQTAVEYSLLIAAIVAALVAIKGVASKAISGRVKDSGTTIGKQFQPKNYYHGWADLADGDSTLSIEQTGTSVPGGGVFNQTVKSEVTSSMEYDSWGDGQQPPR